MRFGKRWMGMRECRRKGKSETRKAKFEERNSKWGALIVPRSLHFGPQTARASGRDDKEEDYTETTESAELAEKRNPRPR
jgi:hypothetical protein